MNRLRKWWKPAMAAVAVVIVLQIGVSLLVRTHRVHRYLIAHLERTFGRPVEVRHFNLLLLPSPRLDAERVTIGEDPAFGREYFLRAEYLTAGLRWTGLLRGHFQFGTLSLSRPSLILVRNNEGRWNLERWLPPAKPNPGDIVSVYGPPAPVTPANGLQKINIDDGRINFKILDEKLAFAFIGVSGSVEQVSSGRWQLRLEAQPWRSGVALQSTGTVMVRGDVAGTSTRLQPAEIHVHWEKVSLADLLRLFRGRDYGVRGVFALDGTAKSGAVAPGMAPAALPGDWTYEVEARAAQIHRWDLTERSDNPRVNVSLLGRWNVASGNVRAERLVVETAKSNLRGAANVSAAATPSWGLRVDSAGIQAADVLAWYRAFQPDVDPAISIEQYFTGAMTLSGWPLELHDAAFSSEGGEAQVPGLHSSLRIGAVEGGLHRATLAVEPVRISYGAQGRGDQPSANAGAGASKRRGAAESRGAVSLAFSHDFEKHEGGVSIDGRIEKVEDVFRLAEDFGRPLNHGWELTGPANASLRWVWSGVPLHGGWNGRIDVINGELQAAGLNQPLQMNKARLEWKDGLRSADVGEIDGFGAQWSGAIRQTDATDADGNTIWNFQLHADRLDAAELDRWIGPRARPGWLQRLLPSLFGGVTSPPTSAASELVRRVSAEGELRVDEFTMEKLKLDQVRVVGALHDLHLDVRDAQAQWAGGTVRAKMIAKFLPRPAYDITAELDRVNLAQLPAPPHAAERFAGVASGTLHLITQGVGREELLERLAGKGDIRVRDVEFRGWNVSASVADGAPIAGESRWSAGEGAFTLKDRGIVLTGLRLEAGSELTFVKGTVSFGQDANLTIRTTTDGRRENRTPDAGQHVLKISGPLDVPRISIEGAASRQPAD
jgi:AsmA family